MDTLSYKTKSQRKEDVEHKWFIVDAENQVLGRMSSKIATVLRGKHKPSYTPHVDCGDYVVVINAEKVRFTGNKIDQKEYITFSGYTGGQKRVLAKELIAKKPIRPVELAVKNMLPKGTLGEERCIENYLFMLVQSIHMPLNNQKH